MSAIGLSFSSFLVFSLCFLSFLSFSPLSFSHSSTTQYLASVVSSAALACTLFLFSLTFLPANILPLSLTSILFFTPFMFFSISSPSASFSFISLLRILLSFLLLSSFQLLLVFRAFLFLILRFVNVLIILISPLLDKPAILQDFISDHAIDILAVTETWLTPATLPSTLNSLTPPGYSVL